jgi:putative tricarboxylic transport membrane protein
VSSRRDLTSAAVFLLFGAGVCAGASRLGFGSVRAPEPGFFPWLGGLALMALAAGLLAQSLRAGRTEARPAPAWRRPATLLAALAAYVPLLEPVGYPVATAALCAVALRILDARWRAALGAGGALAAVTFVLFHRGLGVALPTGVLAWLG